MEAFFCGYNSNLQKFRQYNDKFYVNCVSILTDFTYKSIL